MLCRPRFLDQWAKENKTDTANRALLVMRCCSPFVTLTFDQGRGITTVPLPDGMGKKTVKMVSLGPTEIEGIEDPGTVLVEVRK